MRGQNRRVNGIDVGIGNIRYGHEDLRATPAVAISPWARRQTQAHGSYCVVQRLGYPHNGCLAETHQLPHSLWPWRGWRTVRLYPAVNVKARAGCRR